MSILPSPLKSPTRTSAQVTLVDQEVQGLVLNDEPFETATHPPPVPGSRPAMSVWPSPTKSPVRTSTQFTVALQMSHCVVLNADEPLDTPTHHWPLLETRPAMSFLITTLTLAVAIEF